MLLYLVENSKSKEEDSPLQGYVKPGSLVVGLHVDTEEEKEKREGNLGRKIKDILPKRDYKDVAERYCRLHGLENRECAVGAKIAK